MDGQTQVMQGLNIPLEICRMITNEVHRGGRRFPIYGEGAPADFSENNPTKHLQKLRLISSNFSQAGAEKLFEWIRIKGDNDVQPTADLSKSPHARLVKHAELVLGSVFWQSSTDICIRVRDACVCLSKFANVQDFRIHVPDNNHDRLRPSASPAWTAAVSPIANAWPDLRAFDLECPIEALQVLESLKLQDYARHFTVTLRRSRFSVNYDHPELFSSGSKPWTFLEIGRPVVHSTLAFLDDACNTTTPNLQTLRLNRISPEESPGLVKIIKSARKVLASVCIRRTYQRVLDGDIEWLFRALTSCTKLRDLEVNGLDMRTSGGAMTWANFTSLRRLSLVNVEVHYRFLTAILSGSQQTLEHVTLEQASFKSRWHAMKKGQSILLAVLEALKACPRLAGLSLRQLKAGCHCELAMYQCPSISIVWTSMRSNMQRLIPEITEDTSLYPIHTDSEQVYRKLGELVREVRMRRNDWGGANQENQFVPWAELFATLYPWKLVDSGKGGGPKAYPWDPVNGVRVEELAAGDLEGDLHDVQDGDDESEGDDESDGD